MTKSRIAAWRVRDHCDQMGACWLIFFPSLVTLVVTDLSGKKPYIYGSPGKRGGLRKPSNYDGSFRMHRPFDGVIWCRSRTSETHFKFRPRKERIEKKPCKISSFIDRPGGIMVIPSSELLYIKIQTDCSEHRRFNVVYCRAYLLQWALRYHGLENERHVFNAGLHDVSYTVCKENQCVQKENRKLIYCFFLEKNEDKWMFFTRRKLHV